MGVLRVEKNVKYWDFVILCLGGLYIEEIVVFVSVRVIDVAWIWIVLYS